MSVLNISCKKATYLVSKKEQGKINIFDRIALKVHFKICDLCKRFEEQTVFIVKNAKHQETEEKLSEEVKTRIVEKIVEL